MEQFCHLICDTYCVIAGIFAIGSGLTTYEDPISGGTISTLLPGFGNDGSIWTFLFQDTSNIWAAYTNSSEVLNATTGYYDPAPCIGVIAHYVNTSAVWVLDSATSPCVDTANPVYSVAGRFEAAEWVVYATSSVGLFRYNVSSGIVVKIASPGAHRYFRSVAAVPVTNV